MIKDVIDLLKFIKEQKKEIKNFFAKVRYKFLPLTFDIAISIKSEEGLNSGQYYKQLNSDFNRLLNEHNLTNKIRIKNLSDIMFFNNSTEARNFVKRKKLNLLIYGEFTADNLMENGEKVNQLNVHFVYLHPMDTKNIIGKAIQEDIASKQKLKRDWKIYEKDSFLELQVMSKDIFDISIYIIALTLKFFKYWYLSAELLEQLDQKVQKDIQFKADINFHLYNNYHLISVSLIDLKSDYKNAEMYLTKMLSLDSKNALIMSNLALCKYKNDKIQEAEKLIEEAYSQSPNHPTCQVNNAYLCIRKKDYKKAYRMYQKFFDHSESELTFQPLEVIDFLNKEFKVLNDPALLYGSAVMNYIYKDRDLGIRDLKRFLKKADKIKMKEMIRRATKLVE